MAQTPVGTMPKGSRPPSERPSATARSPSTQILRTPGPRCSRCARSRPGRRVPWPRSSGSTSAGEIGRRGPGRISRERGALQREGAHPVRDILDGHRHSGGVQMEPAAAESALVSRNAPPPRFVTAPVVDHLAVIVAPRRVVDLPRLQLPHVPRDRPVEEPSRVRAADPVLVERRDVDQRGRVPDRRILPVGVGRRRWPSGGRPSGATYGPARARPWGWNG